MCATAGGDIKICSVVPTVYQVFEILGFPELFEIVPTRADAIQKFSRASEQEA